MESYKNFDLLCVLKSVVISILIIIVIPLSTSYLMGNGALIKYNDIIKLLPFALICTIVLYKHEIKKKSGK